ncbi:MAG: outer membrane beta-barrel protein [Ignavibacteriaceae bacterium]|nr:outer membrane beta-barrel protein [Ignavibacteriaceae bacterium]
MKKILVTIIALFIIVGVSQAQNKMCLNIGGNVLLPMGDFGDAANLGFGGTAQFEMQFMPQLVGTAHAGYIIWGTDVDDVDFSAIPVMVGAKYYFMPNSGFYGHGQLGLYFMSVTTPKIVTPIGTFGGDSESDSEFALSLGAGYELPLSPKLMLDLSGAFLIISDANNINLRAGVKFSL